MKKLKPPYRNESNQRYTKQLFWEQWINLPIEDRVIEPVFTLYLDREGLINLGKAYVQDADPSGYKTATRIFHDFGYWAHLMKAGWFREAVETWDKELEAKLYSEGLDKIRLIALSDDKGALAAAKYLADKQFRKDNNTTIMRARPSKKEDEVKLYEAAREEQALREDAERIRLVK